MCVMNLSYFEFGNNQTEFQGYQYGKYKLKPSKAQSLTKQHKMGGLPTSGTVVANTGANTFL